MSLLKGDYIGTHLHEKDSFTEDEVMELLYHDGIRNSNSSFSILSLGITIETLSARSLFKVFDHDPSTRILKARPGYYQKSGREGLSAFASLIADFTEEKLAQFHKDDEYELKLFVTTMSPALKDQMLFECITKFRKESFHGRGATQSDSPSSQARISRLRHRSRP